MPGSHRTQQTRRIQDLHPLPHREEQLPPRQVPRPAQRVPAHEQAQLRLPEGSGQELVSPSRPSYLMGKYKSSLEVAKDAIKINPNDH